MEQQNDLEPMRVFVGTDDSQTVATKVLEYSIKKFASRPVEVVYMRDLKVPTPKDKQNRPRTGFSFYRFMIPQLAGYKGRALYVDADMQVFTDLAELWRIPFGEQKVLCTSQPEPPPAWRNNPFFKPGRQFSVMLLDCSRLDWDINEIVKGLDDGKYTYPQLMFDLCLVKPHEIDDRIPPEWNHLEQYSPGLTKLIHYTVVPTQPWKTNKNPLASVWIRCFAEAVQEGVVTREDIEVGVANKHLDPALLEFLPLSPDSRASASSKDDLLERLSSLKCQVVDGATKLYEARQELSKVRRDMEGMSTSSAWKIGQAMTKPFEMFRRASPAR